MLKFFERSTDPLGKATTNPVGKTTAQPRLKVSGGVTVSEVAKHNTRDDCWFIINGKAYDVTSWIDKHPGGDIMLSYAGMDATVSFRTCRTFEMYALMLFL